MARIMALDYGQKHIGIAVTDPDQMICSPLTTIPKKELLTFLETYLQKEVLECLVIGLPKHTHNVIADLEEGIQVYIEKIQVAFPELRIERMDERYTSMMALQALQTMGYKKKASKEQGLIDKASASLILQSYLELKDLLKSMEL